MLDLAQHKRPKVPFKVFRRGKGDEQDAKELPASKRAFSMPSHDISQK